jgi:hypothetical protein
VSLAVAVTAAIGAAGAFGVGSAVQHATAHAQTGGGQVNIAALPRLLGDARWLLGMATDGLGLGLQVIAVSNGAVSVVQPLHVLGLLVALPVGAALGGPRVHARAATHAAILILGLAGFLVLVGDPGSGRPPGLRANVTVSSVLLVAGALTVVIVRRRGPVVRAVAHGLVSGVLFALTAVLLRVLALHWQRGGAAVLAHAAGLVPLALLLLVGGVAIAIGQAGFQVGPLAASLPAQTAADPVMAVALGARLLHEHLPLDANHVLGYGAALVTVSIAARALARDEYPGQMTV